MKAAGVQRIDHLITTHWHGDHFGGMAELASRVPVRSISIMAQTSSRASLPTRFLRGTYPKLYASAKHILAKPGDRIPMPGLDVRVLTSAGPND